MVTQKITCKSIISRYFIRHCYSISKVFYEEGRKYGYRLGWVPKKLFWQLHKIKYLAFMMFFQVPNCLIFHHIVCLCHIFRKEILQFIPTNSNKNCSTILRFFNYTNGYDYICFNCSYCILLIVSKKLLETIVFNYGCCKLCDKFLYPT